MKTVASPSDGDNRRRDRRRLERDFRYVISAFSSPCVGRPSARYVAALANIHSSLFAMACHFYRREPSRNRREGLAGNAVQEWYRNMQMKGFRAYLTGAEGRPFTPYAMRSLHHICVSLMRRTSREHAVASLDDVLDRRADPRRSAELCELQELCGEVMKVLPPHLRECLRTDLLGGTFRPGSCGADGNKSPYRCDLEFAGAAATVEGISQTRLAALTGPTSRGASQFHTLPRRITSHCAEIA